GGAARLLTPETSRDALRALDGVVLGGGSDIEPIRYRQAPTVESRYDPERDAFEARVLDVALERGLPILGICRGAQLLNVSLGGTLHQDLGAAVPGFRPRRMIFARKKIVIEERTRLYEIMETSSLRVNSLHKQGVDQLGRGLRVSARDGFGVVQAIEHEGPETSYVFGVQWHPEYLWRNAAQRRLFRSLVAASGGKEPADLPGGRSTPVEPPTAPPHEVEPARDTPPPAEPPNRKPPAAT
ncbi:MAG: gamma-glutamyl-gamma-aminobutyrate hydrolase family protein, partial [Polyangiales bacterium]